MLPNPPPEQQWKAVSPYGAQHSRSIVAVGCAADWPEKNVTSETVRICCAGRVMSEVWACQRWGGGV